MLYQTGTDLLIVLRFLSTRSAHLGWKCSDAEIMLSEAVIVCCGHVGGCWLPCRLCFFRDCQWHDLINLVSQQSQQAKQDTLNVSMRFNLTKMNIFMGLHKVCCQTVTGGGGPSHPLQIPIRRGHYSPWYLTKRKQ